VRGFVRGLWGSGCLLPPSRIPQGLKVCPIISLPSFSTHLPLLHPPPTSPPISLTTQVPAPTGPFDFAVDMLSLHPQQLDAARSCMLFNTAGRTFEVRWGKGFRGQLEAHP
jgi:hypothetical protein